MLRVCIASIQSVERSLLLLVVSATGIPLRTIKFFSVLFSSAFSSMLQAVTNKHSMVRRRLCDLHCMGSLVTVFVSSQFARPAIDRQPVVRGRLCHILSFVVSKCSWHFARPLSSSNLQQLAIRPESRVLPTPHHQWGSRRNIATPFGMEKLEWCVCPMLKKILRYVYSFRHDPRT